MLSICKTRRSTILEGLKKYLFKPCRNCELNVQLTRLNESNTFGKSKTVSKSLNSYKVNRSIFKQQKSELVYSQAIDIKIAKS